MIFCHNTDGRNKKTSSPYVKANPTDPIRAFCTDLFTPQFRQRSNMIIPTGANQVTFPNYFFCLHYISNCSIHCRVSIRSILIYKNIQNQLEYFIFPRCSGALVLVIVFYFRCTSDSLYLFRVHINYGFLCPPTLFYLSSI